MPEKPAETLVVRGLHAKHHGPAVVVMADPAGLKNTAVVDHFRFFAPVTEDDNARLERVDIPKKNPPHGREQKFDFREFAAGDRIQKKPAG